MKKLLLLFFGLFLMQSGHGLDCALACFRNKVRRQQNKLQGARPEQAPVLAARPQPVPKAVDWQAIDVLVEELRHSQKGFILLAEEIRGDTLLRKTLEKSRYDAGCKLQNSVKQLDYKSYEQFQRLYYPEVYTVDKEEQEQVIKDCSQLPNPLVGLVSSYLWQKGEIRWSKQRVSCPDDISYIALADNNKKIHIIADSFARVVVGAGISSLRIVGQDRLQEILAKNCDPLVPVQDVLVKHEDDMQLLLGKKSERVVFTRLTINGVEVDPEVMFPKEKEAPVNDLVWAS